MYSIIFHVFVSVGALLHALLHKDLPLACSELFIVLSMLKLGQQ